MNLKLLNNKSLLESADRVALAERENLTIMLHHLREIERRRLFSELKYTSLFDYATKRLKYSADQACRRIAAMRLLKDLPEIEEKISSGALSLTHLGMAQTLFNQERKVSNEISKPKKQEILEKLANTSTREAEKIVVAHSSNPQNLNHDRVRNLTSEYIELKFSADVRLQQKISKLKGLFAHSDPNISLGELFDKLCDWKLEQLEKLPAAPRVKSKAAIKRGVWSRGQRKCSNCASTYALEIDHIIPRALGGLSDEANLRILCRSCNQRAGIAAFGITKMGNYIEKISRKL